ncbi:MAG: pre-peptidase C-terminal domain-containing protein [Myxococcota bacterium]
MLPSNQLLRPLFACLMVSTCVSACDEGGDFNDDETALDDVTLRSAQACGSDIPVTSSQWRIRNASVQTHSGQWVIREMDFCADAACTETLTGTAFDSGASESWSVAANAFDGDAGTMWKTFDTNVVGQSWIGLELDSPAAVAGLRIQTDNVVYSVDSIDVEYLDEGSGEWITADTLTDVPAGTELTYEIDGPVMDIPCDVEVDDQATVIMPGTELTGLSADTGEVLYYAVVNPGPDFLVEITGGPGDADLYLRYGELPTASEYDCRPYKWGNGESCEVAQPSGGVYYIMLRAYASFSDLSLIVSDAGPVAPTPVVEADLSAATGEWLRYEFAVPIGASNATFEIDGGSGDGDMYIRYGEQPTATEYDHRPYKWGNGETVSIADPQAGVYYVGIRSYAAFAGMTLTMSYE